MTKIKTHHIHHRANERKCHLSNQLNCLYIFQWYSLWFRTNSPFNTKASKEEENKKKKTLGRWLYRAFIRIALNQKFIYGMELLPYTPPSTYKKNLENDSFVVY